MSIKEKLAKVRLGATTTIVILTLIAPTILTTGAFAQAPSNDDFDDATVISSLPFSDSINTEEATTAADDPDCGVGGTSHTVWYSFTPDEDITIDARVSADSLDPTSLSVYTGSRGSLEQIACEPDFIFAAPIIVEAIAGQTYYFMVGSCGDCPGGNLDFEVREVLPLPPATNDDFDDATVISSLPFSDSINTEQATTAADDPDCSGNGHTVWWSFTPDEDITIRVFINYSDYDSTLSVYTGSRGSLEQITCKVGGGPVPPGFIDFDAIAGQTYYFMVGSVGDSPGGDLNFQVIHVLPPYDLEVSIDPTGKVSPSTGLVTVSGAVSCSEDSNIDLSGDVTQRAGRANIEGFFGESIFCEGGEEPIPWSVTFEGENGRFVGGRASVTVSAFGCGIVTVTCDSDQESTTVRLRGSR